MVFRPYDVLKKFGNLKLGSGPLTLNGRDVGYLSGGVNVEVGYDSEIIESGTPQLRVGTIPKQFYFRLTAQFLQVSAENYADAVGLDQSCITVWDGLTTYYTSYWTDVLADKQLLTAKPRYWGDLLGFKLDYNGLVVGGGDEPVFMSSDGLTTYTKGTDYILDPANSEIIFLTGGGVSENDRIACKYKCLPPAGKEINFKPSGLLPGQHPILFQAEDSKTGKYVSLYMPLGEASTGGLTTSGDSVWLLNSTIESVYDEAPASASYPNGYMLWDVYSTTTV